MASLRALALAASLLQAAPALRILRTEHLHDILLFGRFFRRFCRFGRLICLYGSSCIRAFLNIFSDVIYYIVFQ